MIPFSAQIKDWMKLLAAQDLMKMRLKYASNPEATEAISQLECRRKASLKLPKLLENEDFIFPTTLSAEQCTSELLARFHTQLVPRGGKVLDMTCGLGVDSFYLANISKSVLAMDIDQNIADAANHNARILGISNFKAICGDSSEYILGLENDSFDAIYVDPARRSNGHKVFFLKDCSPDVSALIPKMLDIARRVVIKASPMLDITAAIKDLQCVRGVYCIGTPTECKELTIVCDREYHGLAELFAVTLTNDDTLVCDFGGKEDDIKEYFVDNLTEGQYLYEPYPAVMKAGLFDRVASEYGVRKLGRDTNVYVSDAYNERFPGRRMKIIYASPFNKRSVKYVKNSFPKANITTRGFVMTAPLLAKNLGIVQGGELFIYGVGLKGGRNYWIAVCEVI